MSGIRLVNISYEMHSCVRINCRARALWMEWLCLLNKVSLYEPYLSHAKHPWVPEDKFPLHGCIKLLSKHILQISASRLPAVQFFAALCSKRLGGSNFNDEHSGRLCLSGSWLTTSDSSLRLAFRCFSLPPLFRLWEFPSSCVSIFQSADAYNGEAPQRGEAEIPCIDWIYGMSSF